MGCPRASTGLIGTATLAALASTKGGQWEDPVDLISYLAAAVGFIVVAGYTGLVWLRRDRAPHVTDDASILLAEPPEGMTAATATVIDHGGTPTAFLAALLDLASRDEIRFHAEADGHLVGIEPRGGDSTDPRVRLNRRRPIGEGEAWLLAQLKEAALAGGGATSMATGAPIDPATIMGGLGPMMSFLGFAAGEQSDDDSPDARARREHGLLDGPPLDPQALAAAVERRSGQPLSAEQAEAFVTLGLLARSLAGPASIAADPDAFAAQVAAISGKPMSPDDLAGMKAWAAHASQGTVAAATATPAPTSGAVPARQPSSAGYISGQAALHLGAPLFFGSLIETYARRHGWIGGLSFFARLRWHLIGVGEVALGLLVLAFGSATGTQELYGLGLGVGFGGVLTFLAAPVMTRVTAEGALIRAQIAAYRRTLQMTFAAAGSIDGLVGASGLPWLETPDQSIAWGIALGLRQDVEAVLARMPKDAQAASAPVSDLPSWYAADSAGAPDAAGMLAAIAAVGSNAGPISAAPPSSER